MTLQDRYIIVFNGEIYNYVELKEELKGKGYVFSHQVRYRSFTRGVRLLPGSMFVQTGWHVCFCHLG